ncbi:MAG: hypothetical protein AAFW65_04630 [Pseudomonadota bacterium]
MKFTATLFAAALTITATAAADEVWSTEIGDVVYEKDLPDGTAVLSYPLDSTEIRGFGYIDGLAGVYQGRTSYSGVWVEPGSDEVMHCKYAIGNPETGALEWNWGRIEMIFVDPDFPGSWVIKRGTCFDELDQYLVGKPVVAGDISE